MDQPTNGMSVGGQETPVATPTQAVPVVEPMAQAPAPSAPSPVTTPTQAVPAVEPMAQAPVPTTPPTLPYSTEVQVDVSSNKVFAVLAYLSLLCLVVLALKSRSRFAAYHARQGLLIMIIQLLSLYTITWGGSGLLLIGVTFGFSVIGILEVLRGNYWEFPYLSKLAQKLTFL